MHNCLVLPDSVIMSGQNSGSVALQSVPNVAVKIVVAGQEKSARLWKCHRGDSAHNWFVTESKILHQIFANSSNFFYIGSAIRMKKQKILGHVVFIHRLTHQLNKSCETLLCYPEISWPNPRPRYFPLVSFEGQVQTSWNFHLFLRKTSSYLWYVRST